MATSNTCDLCGLPAVDEIEAGSKTTTQIKLDVCQEHLAEFKRLMREFSTPPSEMEKKIKAGLNRMTEYDK